MFRLEGLEGIDNVSDGKKISKVTFQGEDIILSGDLKSSHNFRLAKDKTGKVRNGHTLKRALTLEQDFFCNKAGDIALVVDGTDLKLVNADYTLTTLYSGLTSNAVMRFIEHNGVIYMGNLHEMLKYDGVSVTLWGTQRPANTLTLTASSGGACHVGQYYAGYTYVQANGNESGLSPLAGITVTEGQKISISGISASSDTQVLTKRVYLTTANGKPSEAIFLIAEIPNATTIYSYTGSDRSMAIENTTEDFRRPFNSNILLSHYARVYAAFGRFLGYSEELLPECFREANIIPVNDEITAISNDPSGIYISTFTHTYPLRGRDPSDMVMDDPIEIGAIKQQPNRPSNTPYWMSPKGWAGVENGQVKLIDDMNFRLDLASTATAWIGFDIVNNEIIAVVKQ